jgi:hypothetical protein
MIYYSFILIYFSVLELNSVKKFAYDSRKPYLCTIFQKGSFK